MGQLSSYELQQVLSKRFSLGMESEQEIEINAEEVIINSDATVDGDIEELAVDTNAVTESADDLTQIDNVTATLESLIITMESSVLTGGFDKRNAQLANITIESIVSGLGIDPAPFSFGFEEVDEDGEAETKSTIDKAKSVIGALKNSTGALLNKMYAAAASALGNNAAISAKLIAKAGSLKSSIDTANKGGNPISLGRSVKRKLTLDGSTALAPDVYVKELKRLTDKYNSVVKVYSDTDMLNLFVSDIVKSMSGQDGEPSSKKAIIAAVRSISDDVSKSVKTEDGVEGAVSPQYLGGARISLKRPTVKSIETLLTGAVKKDQVSQEGILELYAAKQVTSLGAVLFGLGIAGAVVSVALPVAAFASGGFLAGLGGTALSAGIAYLSYHGGKKGLQLIGKGQQAESEEKAKMWKAFNAKINSVATEASVTSTVFELNTTSVSTESEETATVTSLSATQIAQVATIIQNTSMTTQAMRAELNKRKSIMKSVDQITKAISKENKDANNPLSNAASTYIKQFIKQTIKFEMELTSHAVSTMKAALAYAEASNGSAPAAEDKASTESVDVND